MIAQIDLQVQMQVPQDTAQPQTQDSQNNTDSFRSLLQGMQAKSADADTGATDKVSGDSDKADLKKDAKAETTSSLPQTAQAILAQAAQAGNHPQAPVSPISAQAAPASQLTTVQAVPQTIVPLADAMARKASPDGSVPVSQNGSPAVQSQSVVTAQVPKNIPAASQQNMAPEAMQVSQNIPAANKAAETAEITQSVPTAPRQSTASETAQIPPSIPTAAKQNTVPDAAPVLQNIPAASGQSTVSGTASVTDSTAPAAQSSARANPVLAASDEMPTAEAGKAPAEEKLPSQENGTPSTQPVPTFYTSGRVIVKVSDAPAAAKTPVGSQIANAVTDGLKAGKQQFQVDLYPQSLGKVSVNLVSQNGMLTIEIAAQNPKTQSLIASSSGEIRSLLHASTGQNVQVTNQQQNAQQYTGQNGSPYQQQQFSQQQQQQQQDAEQRQSAARWYAAGNSSGFSTDDFLTAMRKAAV